VAAPSRAPAAAALVIAEHRRSHEAVLYRGPRELAVEDVEDPKIESANDAVIRITTTNICGSDLHMYEGRTDVKEGKVLGHENMGVVEAVGDGVDRIKVSDRVSVRTSPTQSAPRRASGPFNIACGTCGNCNARWTSFCERTNPDEGVREPRTATP
jgi:glutathione-independent formaldehyde dehydrogenase